MQVHNLSILPKRSPPHCEGMLLEHSVRWNANGLLEIRELELTVPAEHKCGSWCKTLDTATQLLGDPFATGRIPRPAWICPDSSKWVPIAPYQSIYQSICLNAIFLYEVRCLIIRHFQCHKQFWLWDGFGSCLIWLATTNHAYCDFKLQKQISDAKLIRGQSKDPPYVEVIT